ncbi:hypothetical protein [Delftia sp. 60]|uniref:hypothetical protein n=1 Tax=Delftia sp. 60 TaxID=2035216 RepID=UPI00211DB951|nr:hypothetical protein [Delftia sp. 60]
MVPVQGIGAQAGNGNGQQDQRGIDAVGNGRGQAQRGAQQQAPDQARAAGGQRIEAALLPQPAQPAPGQGEQACGQVPGRQGLAQRVEALEQAQVVVA